MFTCTSLREEACNTAQCEVTFTLVQRCTVQGKEREGRGKDKSREHEGVPTNYGGPPTCAYSSVSLQPVHPRLSRPANGSRNPKDSNPRKKNMRWSEVERI